MRLQVKGRHIDVTDSLFQYAEKKLGKLEQPKRFQLTAAPAGEFLSPKQLFERYGAMHSAELAKTNAELTRNFIRNYQQVAGLVPYVVGRFTIIGARELGPNDLFTTGMVTLTDAVDFGEVLIMDWGLAKVLIKPALAERMPEAENSATASHGMTATRLRSPLSRIPVIRGNFSVP